MRRASWALALLVLGSATATGQPRKVYLRACTGEDASRLEDLRKALDAGAEERAAGILDTLFAAASAPERGARLVEAGELLHVGLHAHLLARVQALPPGVEKALRTLQQTGAERALISQAPPGAVELLRRYPASERAASAAEALWARAAESQDVAQCLALERFLARLHPARLETPEARARRAVLRASAGRAGEARALAAGLKGELAQRTARAVREILESRPAVVPLASPPRGAKLVHASNTGLRKPDPKEEPAEWREFSPAFAQRLGERIVVSNGTVIAVFGSSGALECKLPRHASGATKVPAPETGFQGRVAGSERVLFAPLVLEHWLAPARFLSGGRDASLGERFYSLLAFDPRAGRVLWWDGDAGQGKADARGGGPPGWSRVEGPLLDLLARAHVLATAADGRRVYVALTIKGEEPELRVMAFAVTGGERQSVVLEPAWERTTYVLSAERAKGSAEDAPVAAEIGASLVLDGQGRLVCTTNLGVAACVDTGSGELLWVREPRPDRRQQGSFRAGPRRTQNLTPPPEPARLIGEGEKTRALFFAGSRLVSVDVGDGAEDWQRDVGDCHRLLAGPRRLVAYGGNSLIVFAPDGTRLTSSHERLSRPIAGEGVRIGDSLLLPTLHTARGGRRSVTIDRFAFGRRSSLGLGLLGSSVVPRITRPANLALVPGGVVATTRDRVVFLRWN